MLKGESGPASNPFWPPLPYQVSRGAFYFPKIAPEDITFTPVARVPMNVDNEVSCPPRLTFVKRMPSVDRSLLIPESYFFPNHTVFFVIDAFSDHFFFCRDSPLG